MLTSTTPASPQSGHWSSSGLPDGESIGFTKNSNGSYTPEIGVEDLTLTYTAGTATYTVKDLDGTVVTFTKPTGSSEFKPSAVTAPGSNQTTTTAWETVTVNGTAVTRPTRMLAPVPAGVTCGVGIAGLVRGCRALSLQYSGGAVAPPAAGQIADYPSRIKAVSITAWDPDATPAAMKTITLSRYADDSDGRLREVWDPRLGLHPRRPDQTPRRPVRIQQRQDPQHGHPAAEEPLSRVRLCGSGVS